MRSRQKWTDEDLSLLEACIEKGMTDAAIGKRLGCTANAVNIARKRHGIAPRRDVMLTARSVQQRLGLSCAKTVTWWIKSGYLKGRRGQPVGRNHMWYVTEDALQRFMEDAGYWHLWEPERIPDRDVREWAREIRTVKFLTTREVGERLGFTHQAVNDWLNKGLLPGLRHGNWVVREVDLLGFIPPCELPRKCSSMRRFTANEDAWLRHWIREQYTHQEMADSLGRDVGSIYGRLDRLGLRRGVQRQILRALPKTASNSARAREMVPA